MFSRPCDQFSGRSQRPGGRRRQDPATRTPSYPGRPACTLRSDPGARRRPASFGDRPEIPGAESMFSRLCGRFSGRLDRPDRPRRQGPSKRTPLDPGAGARHCGAVPGRGGRLCALAIGSAKSRARIPCFQGLAAGFPGDRNSQAGTGARTRQGARRHRKGARPGRRGAMPDRGDGMRASAIHPAESRARNQCSQGLAAGFAGDPNDRTGTGATTRRSARRHPKGARPRRYGAMSDPGDGPRASVIEPAKSRARIPCFQRLAGGFPGGRNGQGASRS